MVKLPASRFYPAVYLHSKITQWQLGLVLYDNLDCDEGEVSNPSLLLLVKLSSLNPA